MNQLFKHIVWWDTKAKTAFEAGIEQDEIVIISAVVNNWNDIWTLETSKFL